MNEEKELLRGQQKGFFNKEPIILTSKHLTIGERRIELSSILEVYAAQERINSKLVVRLTDGSIVESVIIPEKNVSGLTWLGGGIGDVESELRANSKATTDRWVNLINAQARAAPVVRGRKFCRYCGAETKADAVFCEDCGKKIGETGGQPTEDDAAMRARRRRRFGEDIADAESEYWICPSCKTLNSNELEICKQCKKLKPN